MADKINPPATDVPDCGDMIVIRPEREGGVIFACTRQQGHIGEHTSGGSAEDFRPFLVRWVR